MYKYYTFIIYFVLTFQKNLNKFEFFRNLIKFIRRKRLLFQVFFQDPLVIKMRFFFLNILVRISQILEFYKYLKYDSI